MAAKDKNKATIPFTGNVGATPPTPPATPPAAQEKEQEQTPEARVIEANGDGKKPNKSKLFRDASAAIGDTSPAKIMAHLKAQGVDFAQAEDALKKHSGLITSALHKGGSNGAAQPEMDLDTILARLELVRGFAATLGGKDKLLAIVDGAKTVESMCSQVGGLENLLKFAAKV